MKCSTIIWDFTVCKTSFISLAPPPPPPPPQKKKKRMFLRPSFICFKCPIICLFSDLKKKWPHLFYSYVKIKIHVSTFPNVAGKPENSLYEPFIKILLFSTYSSCKGSRYPVHLPSLNIALTAYKC